MKRWALDIGDRSLEDIETHWPGAFDFLIEVVKPTRTPDKLQSYKGLIDRWWQFWNHRADGMRSLREREIFIAFPKAAKYPFCLLASSDWLYTNKVVLLAPIRSDMYAICLSSLFRQWLYTFSVRSLGADPKTSQLSISEAVSTFPLPDATVPDVGQRAASRFNDAAIEWSTSSGDGLTGFLNLISNPACADEVILAARALLEQVNLSVSGTYGWGDIDTSLGFQPYPASTENDPWRWALSEDSADELMQRLTALNRERFEAEQATKAVSKAKTPKSRQPRAGIPTLLDGDLLMEE